MNLLQGYSDLEIYTDGSLIKNEELQLTSMGFSRVENLLINFKGLLKGFNSFTCAEILAILSFLSVCPCNSNVQIFTDS
jgi:hypothetical protein